VGNAGTNLPWHATIGEPITLYLNDFNKDGRNDPVICSYVQGKSYPVAARDELLLQMNNLRKKYITYSSFANAALEDVVAPEQIEASAKFKINTLQSSILENLGNGNFKLKALPITAQFSSVRGILIDDFNGDKLTDILLAGNFYPYRTQYGPCDAGKGLLLQGKKDGYTPINWEDTGFYADGDIRNMVLLKSKSNKKFIVAARNNESTLIFQLNND
jgi:hypothetical protein